MTVDDVRYLAELMPCFLVFVILGAPPLGLAPGAKEESMESKILKTAVVVFMTAITISIVYLAVEYARAPACFEECPS